MGSGGLRRLQISRSGASCVRGGFDSHAFPPFLALALAGAFLIAGTASATPLQLVPARADSLSTAARDTAAAAGRDTSGQAAAAARAARRFSEQPRAVMLRSLVVPGWGQLHNHAWFKAAGVAGGEGWLLHTILHDRVELDHWRDRVNAAADAHDDVAYTSAVNHYNQLLDGFVGSQWLLGGVIAYALVDAYVDAHFRHFEVEFRNDPALPPGVTPEDVHGDAGGGTKRLSLRWHF